MYHPYSPHILCLLLPFSILGVLARLGLQALSSYDGQAIFPLAYVQAFGCFVMGLAIPLKEILVQKYPPVYVAITTGFCGSLTTFSGWQLDVFNSWVNASGLHRSGFQSFIDGLSKTIFTLLLSLASLLFGSHLATLVYSSKTESPPPELKTPSNWRYLLVVLSIATYASAFVCYFLLPPNFRHQATASLLFAPPGALTRYVLSTQLNHLNKAFPLGTFTANIFGTGLLCAFNVMQHVPTRPTSPRVCTILQGLSDGYCGCLTTVSTFAAELLLLKGSAKLKYGAFSYATAQILILVIYVPLIASHHSLKERSCSFE